MRSGQVSRLHRSAEKNITSDRQRTKIKSAKQGDQKEKYRPTIRKQKKRCSFPFSAAFYRWQLLCPPPKPPLSFGTPSAFLLHLCINHDNALNLLPPTLVLRTRFRFLLLFLSFPRYCLSARKIKLHLSSFRKRIPRPQTIATTLPARPRPFTDPPANR